MVYCLEPYMTFDQRVFGNYAVCCRSYPLPYTIQEKTIEEHFNSDEMVNLRNEFETNAIGPYTQKYCEKCLNHETAGIQSRRQFRHEQFASTTPAFQDQVKNIISQSKQKVHLKLQDMRFYSIEFKMFGNLCNLKCMMCHPHQSSSLAVDWKKNGKWDGPTHINSYMYIDSTEFYREMDIMLSNTNQIKFTGGEPLMNMDILDLIYYAKDNNYAKDLELIIITNGTKAPSKFLEVIQHFKSVTINISCDGVFDVNEYQRVGSSFSIIDKNIDLFKQYPNVKVQLTSAITAINVGSIDQIIDYANYKKIHADVTSIVLKPKWISVYVLPKHIRQHYINKLKYKNDQVVSALSYDNEEYMKLFPEFIQQLRAKDRRDNTDFLQIIPELKDELRKTIDIRTIYSTDSDLRSYKNIDSDIDI